jgi:hypothetical protein
MKASKFSDASRQVGGCKQRWRHLQPEPLRLSANESRPELMHLSRHFRMINSGQGTPTSSSAYSLGTYRTFSPSAQTVAHD